MQRVALTGGIATGKSYVARRLADADIPIVDADVLARQAVAPGTPGLNAIVERFGRTMLTADGTLDRAKLGALVFADQHARRDLEAIVHPDVRRGVERFFADLPKVTRAAVADIPLLFETGQDGQYDLVVVAACTPEQQITRLIARDGLLVGAAEARVAAQWPIADKVRRADVVIRTDGTFVETDAQVDLLVRRLAQ